MTQKKNHIKIFQKYIQIMCRNLSLELTTKVRAYECANQV